MGRVRGVPIRLHWSLALLLPYLAVVIGVQFEHLSATAGLHEKPVLPAWAWGCLLAVALLVAIALHELGHTFVALRKGAKVRSITLMALGGISEMSEMPHTPRAEALMAVTGPLVSLALGIVFLTAGLALPVHHTDARFGLVYFGEINLALGAFNLLPAFPMDGGRVLRAALVHHYGYAGATSRAALVGKVVAAALALAGILGGSPLLLFIALFLWMAGTSEARLVEIEETLGNRQVWTLAHPIVAPVGTVTLPVGSTARAALRAMLENQVTAISLTDEQGATVAAVTQEDLLAAARFGFHPWPWSQDPQIPRPV